MAGGGEGGISRAASPSEASEAVEVVDDYICPITTEIMTDPVCTADGFTYERTAITEWLRTNDTSPSTGDTLDSKALIPNHLVRSLLRAFIEASSAASTAQPPTPFAAVGSRTPGARGHLLPPELAASNGDAGDAHLAARAPAASPAGSSLSPHAEAFRPTHPSQHIGAIAQTHLHAHL